MENVELFAKVVNNMLDTYKRKNHDYGDSFGKTFKEYGAKASTIRLEDKLARYKTLLSTKAEVTDENKIDTLYDLANYTVMTIMQYMIAENNNKSDKILNMIGKANCDDTDCDSCLLHVKAGGDEDD